MTNYSAILNTYNYFLPISHKQKSSSPYDSHNKTELKGVYNHIRQLYKNSPTYLLDTSMETRKSAVQLKDTALQFEDSLTSFTNNSYETMTQHQVGTSSNEDIATTQYLGSPNSLPDSFELEVFALSKPQINVGSLLPSDECTNLENRNYTFNLSNNNYQYEFSFHINELDTNLDIQNRLTNLVNNSNVGISASVMKDSSSQSALRLESNNTGLPLGKSELFTITASGNNPNSKNSQFISYFGLDETMQPASNSQFSINGIERFTMSNTFRVDNNCYEVTLTGISPSEGITTTIGVEPDTEIPRTTIQNFVAQVNNFTNYIQNYGTTYPKAFHLLKDVNATYRTYQDSFSSIGLEKDSTGTLIVDDELLSASLKDSEELDNFSQFSNFAEDLTAISKKISIHPMQYNENRIVDYKNPTKPKLSPAYITSAYSGFLFNSYC